MSSGTPESDCKVESLKGFQYVPLSDHQNTIRVVCIQPGAEKDPTHCDIRQIPIIKNTYSCLSYVWGAKHPTKEIYIDGKPLSVRENLWSFLHTARRYGYTGPIWIDAISINQSNIVEKTAQIKIMGDIYYTALRVIVWLAFQDDELEALLRCQTLLCETHPHRHIEDPTLADIWFRIQMNANYPTTYQILVDGESEFFQVQYGDYEVLQTYIGGTILGTSAFESMSKSTYWFRAWVVQETALANSTKMLIHDKLVDFGVASRLLSFYRTGPRRTQIPWKFEADEEFAVWLPPAVCSCASLHADNMGKYGRPGPYHGSPDGKKVARVLKITAGRECDDPRDRVYSVLSLLGATDHFEVDYDEEPINLFGRTIQFLCDSYGFEPAPLSAATQLFSGLRLHLPTVSSLPILSKVLADLRGQPWSDDKLPKDFWTNISDLAKDPFVQVALCNLLIIKEKLWLIVWPLKLREKRIDRQKMEWALDKSQYLPTGYMV